MRVVSLIASTTEMVCALGLERLLVARSHECDHPASITGLPAVTAPRIDAAASSGEIDRQVRAGAREALSLYRVDEAALKALTPDVILTQVQCAVCAVSLKDVETALKAAGISAEVVSMGAADLTGLWDDIARVAKALGAQAEGQTLIAELQGRLAEIEESAARHPRPSIACLEWLDPLMCSGHWIPELVELAGGRCLFGEAGKPSPAVDWEAVRAADPDVLTVLPCGFGIERTLREKDLLTRLPGWNGMKAVQMGRVFALDGNRFFNRPGPRLVESCEILGEILHPAEFKFGHEGNGWRRLAA